MSLDGKAFGREIVELVKGYVDRVLAPRDARVVALDARLKAVEECVNKIDGRGIRYCGVYQRAQFYERGDVVTSAGGCWIALRDVDPTEAPGSAAWQLAVKGGG